MRNNRQQFTEAYEKYADALFRFGLYKLSDRELALNTVNDTFVKAWQYAEKGEPIQNMQAFLYKIMNNLIIDEYRRRKDNDSLENLLEEQGFDPPFDDTDRWMDRLDGEIALKLISKLPDDYGDAIYMRFVEDLSLTEIAEATGEQENTIAVRIHRGLEKLRKLYKHEKPE